MDGRQSRWVALRTVSSEEEAYFMQGMLEAAGIPCTLESLKYHAEPVNLGRLSEIRVHVLKTDLQRARELLTGTAEGDSSTAGDRSTE